MRAQRFDLVLEVFRAVEGLVDRCKAQVRNLIQVAQWLQNGKADLVRLHLGTVNGSDALLYFVGEALECIIRDISSLTSASHALDDLVSAELFCHSGALCDKQNGALDGSEARATISTFATPADGDALLDCSRVDDA